MGTRRNDTERAGLRSFIPGFLGALVALACAAAIAEVAPRAFADTLQTYITISICSNGIVDPGEACDDGVNIGVYGPTAGQRSCNSDCQSFAPYCGDGILQVRFGEACDEGAANGGTGLCSATCQPLPAVPPSTPSHVVGSIPTLPAPPGVIPASTKTQVVLRGKAYPNSDVNVLLDGTQVASVRSDSNADFLYSSDAATPGTATYSFWAKDSDGLSSITTSVVFDVVQSAVTSVNNIFLPPTLGLSDQKIKPGGLLTLSGQSVPKAQVITDLDQDASSTLVAVANQAGAWALQLDTHSIKIGFHSVKASFMLSSSTKSGFGKSFNFFIGDKLPSGNLSPDLNEDGKVNLVDFSIFLLSWNTHDVRTDFNQDGSVNLADFSIMLFAWTG